jgi:ankyrin repeat protein
MTLMFDPIHIVVANGDIVQLTQMLKTNPHLVHARDSMQETPLHIAQETEIARLLIQYGADPNARGGARVGTPLHAVAQRGNIAVATALLEAGADVNASNVLGETSLHLVATAEVARLLVRHGAALDALDHAGLSPLYRHLKNAELVNFLIQAGARLDLRDRVGRSPVHYAAELGAVEVLDLLLEGGLDVNEQDPISGWTPLHEAAQHDQVQVVRWLLEHGADPRQRSLGGETPLDIARARGRHVVCQLLETSLPLPSLPAVPPAEPFVAQRLRLHPLLHEAIIIGKQGMLGRWQLAEPMQRLLAVQVDALEIRDVAVAPTGEWVALATPEKQVEVRAWEDFRLIATWPISHPHGVASLAISPNGRWLALGGEIGWIKLLETAGGHHVEDLEGGDWTGGLAFSPSSDLLASACSYQGGAEVVIDQISQAGQISRVQELDRSDMNTPPTRFVDTLPHLAFSPDGRWLVLFETCSMPGDKRAATGWYGNLVLYEVATGEFRWQVPLDMNVTTLSPELGAKLRGGRIEVAFLSEEEIVCGGPSGRVLCFDVHTGQLKRQIHVPSGAAIISLAYDKRNNRLYCVSNSGELFSVSVGEPS